jgi:hypothetical protein
MELRGLTPKERKEIFKKLGFTLLNTPLEKSEEVSWAVLDIVVPDKEFETFKEEQEAANTIINLTYGIGEEDSKN